MAQFSELSEDVILHIFSFIPFRLLRRTICRVCKMWHRIASDPAIVRKASSHEFESIRLCDTINDCQLKNLVKRIIWARTEDVTVLDLAKISISWEYVDDVSRRSHWRKLRFLFFLGVLFLTSSQGGAFFCARIELKCELPFWNTPQQVIFYHVISLKPRSYNQEAQFDTGKIEMWY